MRQDRRKPVIGITGPDKRLAMGSLAVAVALRRLGARPVRMRPGQYPSDIQLDHADSGLQKLDGLVISGGTDISPLLYGEESGPWVPPDIARDRFELAVLSWAARRSLPLLGICRGAQLMNVAAGGTLHTDISKIRRHTSNRPTLCPVKPIRIQAQTRLAKIVNGKSLRVNSIHHQAVKKLGHGLKTVARDRDRIVQAIESTSERFLLGVQWHPEYLQMQGPHQNIFRHLVRAAQASVSDSSELDIRLQE